MEIWPNEVCNTANPMVISPIISVTVFSFFSRKSQILFPQLPETLCYSFVSDYSRSVLIDFLFLATTDQVMPYSILIFYQAISPVSF